MKKFFSIFLWLTFIFGVIYLGITYLPFAPTFPYYDSDIAPLYSRFAGVFAHFDGIHYLRLAGRGYDDTGIQAFFPVFPLLIRFISSVSGLTPLVTGVVLNILFLFGTIYLAIKYLIPQGFSRFVLLLLLFPTSFFLVMLYSESLFIFLVTLFFVLLKSKQYFWSALVAGLASGTRVVGFALAFTLMIQYLPTTSYKLSKLLYAFLLLFVSLLGLLSYMYFLKLRFGDPLMFVHVQSLFGAGRSDGTIILLPQLLYRYLHILLTVPVTSLTFIRSLWELAVFILSVWALYLSRHKLTLAELIFCLLVLLFPTLSGTLSSYPRYALSAVPLFLVLPGLLPQKVFVPWIALSSLQLIVTLILFTEGLFIA